MEQKYFAIIIHKVSQIGLQNFQNNWWARGLLSTSLVRRAVVVVQRQSALLRRLRSWVQFPAQNEIFSQYFSFHTDLLLQLPRHSPWAPGFCVFPVQLVKSTTILLSFFFSPLPLCPSFFFFFTRPPSYSTVHSIDGAARLFFFFIFIFFFWKRQITQFHRVWFRPTTLCPSKHFSFE